MHSEETPCACPKCGWLGMYRDTDKYVPTDSDFNELEPRYVCPRCTNEIDVQTLGQKGLDALRQEHHLLLKGSYQKDATIEERNERQRYLERFFEHIHQPLKLKNETRKAFEEMMGFVAQVEKSRYDPYPRRSYATAGTATVVGHPSCVNRLSKATRTCNSVT